MPTIKQITRLINQRDNLIAAITLVLASKIDLAQESLLALVITKLVDSLDKDADIIKNTAANRSRILLMERIYSQFVKDKGIEVVAAVASGVDKILAFNEKYFEFISEDVYLVPMTKQVKTTIQNWIGLTERNTVAKAGYLDKLVNDETAKQKIKDLLLNATVTQKGFNETRKNLKDLITGIPGKVGLIESRYTQVVHDTMSVVDRTTHKMYADKLKLNYFLYLGGIVRDSRAFCIKRDGKVFTTDEVKQWNPAAEGTNVPIGYDPFTMAGGYNCRHHLSAISKQIAVSIRPELA